MGCGGSKNGVAEAWNDEPPIEPISVPDLNPEYPRPTPPPNTKEEISSSVAFADIVARVRQQHAQMNTSTYETLINSLTAGCTSDLQKLRAIFVWLYLQDIYGSFYSQVKDPHSPRGYMKLIKTQNGTYETFFALLCRAAGIPCTVIRGIGKGDAYVIGQKDTSGLESAWNAVYVVGGWRFVHPLWAFFEEKQMFENGLRPRPGNKRANIQEFFWLTDPDQLICFCKPHADEWQLLKTKWDLRKFLNIPLFTEDYFESGLKLLQKYYTTTHSEHGVLVLELEHEHNLEPSVDAQFEADKSNNEVSRKTNTKDFVAIASSSNTKTLAFRFPTQGWYVITIYGGSNSRKPKIITFRVDCKSVRNDPQPFPLFPRDGFGILPIAKQFGISHSEPNSGIILVRPKQEKHFSFICSQKLEAQATLTHVKHSPEMFVEYVSSRSTDRQLLVNVIVPEEEHLEYGLQIAVRAEREANKFTVVANYLLVDENWQKKTASVPPFEKNQEPIKKEEVKAYDEPARKELIAATNDDSISRLEKAIGEFERHGLEDNGDLTRAKSKLKHLHLENLRDKTAERKLAQLELAIDSAHKSHVVSELKNSQELRDAELTRQQLARMKLYLHKVLALNKATIAEMHSYQRPRPLVHQVMKATFRILGEPNSKLKSWPYVQNSMRRLGRNSMLARMERCDVVHLKEKQVDDAEEYLDEANLRSVRMCSAGAGTFYVWSNNMISEYCRSNDDLSDGTKPNNKENAKNNHKRNDYSYASDKMDAPRSKIKSR